MAIKKVSISSKFSKFNEYWTPKVVGELNNQHIKLAKIKGTFDWHKHELEDEMFLVIQGSFVMELRDQCLEINEGEFVIIPRGIEHRPVAAHEAHIMLFEPKTTVNTGENTTSHFTQTKLEEL